EIKEEYTFMNQDEFETSFRDSGFRVLHSAPIYNDWIIRNRWEGRVRLFDLYGRPVPFPPTNYVNAGGKVARERGVTRTEAASRAVDGARFGELKTTRRRRPCEVVDVVDRAYETVGDLPYCKGPGPVFVWGKRGLPRRVRKARSRS